MLNSKEDGCFMCESPDVELHHIMFGTGQRKISDEWGCTVYLCPRHHRGTKGVHGRDGRPLNMYLKRLGQRDIDQQYGKGKFFELFGKNYLD